MFVEPLGSQSKQSTFSFFFVTTIQSSNYHLYFQRRKLRLRDTKEHAHVIYQVLEVTGLDGSRAYGTRVHFSRHHAQCLGMNHKPQEGRGLGSKQREGTEAS